MATPDEFDRAVETQKLELEFQDIEVQVGWQPYDAGWHTMRPSPRAGCAQCHAHPVPLLTVHGDPYSKALCRACVAEAAPTFDDWFALALEWVGLRDPDVGLHPEFFSDIEMDKVKKFYQQS